MAVLQSTTITGGLTMNGMSAGFMKISPTGTVTVDTNAYLTAITSGQITGALGYTPYNSSNPAGYITSSALSSYLPLSGGTMTGPLQIGTSVYTTAWNDGGGSYVEAVGNSTATRKLRLQSFNGSSAYAQWFMDGGNLQIYGEINGNRNFLIDGTTAYIRHNGVDRLWGGSDGTRNSGWAYHTNNDTGLHWPNNGWHFYPKDVNDIYMRSGSSTNVAIAMNTGATTRGYVYAENDNTIGFLTNSRSWAFRTYSNGNAQVYGYLTVNGAGTSSSIYMNDSDEGQREIHCNSNRIGFLTQAGSWGAWLYDGADWEAASSVRAPIFYDSNDTTYYGDFNGTSRFYQAIVFGDSSRYSAVSTTINGTGAGDKLILYGNASNYDARVLVGTDYDFIFKSQGSPSNKGMFRFYSGPSASLALEIRADQNVYAPATVYSAAYRGNANAGGTGEATYHPAGIYSVGTNWLYGTMYMNNNSIRDVLEVYNNGWFRTVGHQGLYNPTNNAHFYPNNASYGSWRIDGTRNGWHGIHFDSGSTLMMNGNETGVHREGYGWQWRWDNGTFYVHGNSYGGGTGYAVIHAGNIGSQSVNYASSSGTSTNTYNIYYNGLGSGSMNISTGASGVYRNENGNGGNLNYAPVLHLAASDTMWQIQGDYYSSSTLRWRAGYAGNWYAWRDIIHSGNIGSQSVNYANNAGTLDGNSASSFVRSNVNAVTIQRHLDASTTWTSGILSLFLGWYSGKVILGNNNTSGHDYASGLGSNTVVSTNPFYTDQSLTVDGAVSGSPYRAYLGYFTAGLYSNPYVGLKVTNVNSPSYYSFVSSNEISLYTGYGASAQFTPGQISFNSASCGGGNGGGYAYYSNSTASGYDGSSYGGDFNISFSQLRTWSNYYGEGLQCQAWDNANLYIGGTLYQNNWSDEKYKDNVLDIEDALGKINSIRGVEYDWNDLAFEETGREGHDVGVIAQEVQAVYPFAVREVDKERQDYVQTSLVVDYEKLIPLLVQSVKELSAEVDVLKIEVQTLKDRIDGSGI